MILKGHVHSFMRDRPSIRSAIQPIAARTGCGRGPAGLFTDNCGQPAPRSFLPPTEPLPSPLALLRRTDARRGGKGRNALRPAGIVDPRSPHRRENSRKGPSNFREGGGGPPRTSAAIPRAITGRAKLHCAESQTNDAVGR